MAQPTIKAKDIIGQSLERNRFFYGKLMSVRDFDQEQEHFTAKRWIINRLLFGSSVICGLQVENPNGAPTTIEIKPGVALDPLGREVTVVEIPGGNKFDLTKVIPAASPPPSSPFTGEKKGFICLSYRECPREPVPSLKSSSCDEVCESNRLRETFDVSWDEETSTTPSPSLCEKWLNRTTVSAEDAKFRIERTSPVWVRASEVFEVSVRVTARQDAANVQITETRTGGSFLIEPTPSPSGTSQFPTPSVNLKAGEFFVYVYQVKSPAAIAKFQLSLGTAGLPALTSTVEVLSEADAKTREGELTIETNCGEPTESCVRIAELTVHFSAGKPDQILDIKNLGSPRFRYSLERVTEMLDCVRANLLADAGSPRPGHMFVTFNDRETGDPQPIGPNASPGTTPTFSSGRHAHALLRHEPSGLQFTGAANNELWINGNVGGDAINFLNTVSGQTPVQPAHLVTKAYVDSAMVGLDWKMSVLDKDLTAPPAGPKTGDRYLLFNATSAAWKGHQNDIATFNGKAWEFNTPDPEGAATFVEDENTAYLFVDGNWIPFLAAPSVTAGAGLVASGAVLSVGVGKGILVNPDDVGIAYDPSLPQPIGRPGSASAGSSDTSTRGGHIHELPLSKKGGLEFAADGSGLSINGAVAGATITFLNVVSGQTPTQDQHLATKAYVDGKVVPPQKVVPGAGLFFDQAGALAVGQGQGIIVGDDTVSANFSDALPRRGSEIGDPGKEVTLSRSDHSHPVQSITPGDGLVQSGTVVSVGKGKGILVNPDDVAIAFDTKPPQLIASVSSSTGSSDFSNRSDHSHGLLLSNNGGLAFTSDGLSINGQVAGAAIDFQKPVLGQTPTDVRHLATKKYVDDKVVSPPKIGAGKGLVLDATAVVLAVGESPTSGIVVTEDLVSVNFSTAVPLPATDIGSPGSSVALSRGDHSHPLPAVTPVAATGLVVFRITGFQVPTAQSGPINPGLGKGSISVQLALVTAVDTFVFGPGPFVQAANVPQLSSIVNSAGTFQILATALANQKVLPDTFSIRWFAYKPGVEVKQIEVVVSPNITPTR